MSGPGECRACGSEIVQPRTGRKRQWCHRCRPAGAPPPTAVLRRVLRARRERERAATAARGAAYRRVARAHPDEYQQVLTSERAARGLGPVRCPHCAAPLTPAAGACFKCGELIP